MKKVHVVNHTHWDREWYFTTMDAMLLSDQTFSLIIDELVHNPDAKFCLDGQSSILEDFVAKRPEKVTEIKKLVANKQLAIGPWYTQTDAFFVDEESFIRNLIIGIRDSRKYGEEMKIGYLPDTFGFNAQMPTILANCGLDNIVFWRGINFKKHVSGPYFKWKGLGTKEIVAMNLVDGYGTAAFLKDTPEYIEERLIPAVKKIESLTDSENLLLPAGGDQLEIIRDLPKTLQQISQKTEYEFLPSSYEEFLATLTENEHLPEYTGEFREPCTTRTHKSIGSVRYDIKKTNYLIEQKLLRRVEPLLVLAENFGIQVSHELVIDAWKKIMEGHAHDSMGGCVSDAVAEDILHRMKEADELADGIENYIVKRFSEKLQLNTNQVLVFNTTSSDFTGLKLIDFVSATKQVTLPKAKEAVVVHSQYFEGKDNLLLETPEGPKYINEEPYYRLYVLADVQIPSMGFQVFEIEKTDQALDKLESGSEAVIENSYYQIYINEDQLCLKLANGKKINDFLTFEDTGNAGDTYDFSPIPKDVPIFLTPQFVRVEKSALVEKMILTGNFDLPKNLEARVHEKQDTAQLKLTLTLTLTKDSPLIDCVVHVDNQVLSHRLRAKITPTFSTTKTIASLPFGFIERQELLKEIPDWQQKYVEYPIDLEPYDKSVSMVGETMYLTAYGKGLKEYQLRKNELYLTLFASTSQLGKPNLAYRPGRASGDTTKKGHVMIPTPKAELLGELTFEFALSLTEGAFDEQTVAKNWRMYTEPSICYQNQSLNKFVHRLDNKIQPIELEPISQQAFSLMKVTTQAIDSSFSFSMYDQDAYLLRLANPTKQPVALGEITTSHFSSIEFVDCQEQSIEQVESIPPYDMVTLKLWRGSNEVFGI